MTLVQIYLLAAAPFVGSFLSVLTLRLPADKGWALGRSHCPSCGAQLGMADLIPLASYLVSRGHCRHCGDAIAPFYPAMELAALAVALWGVLSVPPTAAVPTAVLAWMLLGLSVIDIRDFILPDVLTLPLIAAGLGVTALLSPNLVLSHAAAAAAGALLMWGVAWAYRRLRGRDGLGLGDAKLFAAAGAWTGPMGLPSVLLIASASGLLAVLTASVATKRPLSSHTKIPLGPFLSLGIWLTWLYGPLMPT